VAPLLTPPMRSPPPPSSASSSSPAAEQASKAFAAKIVLIVKYKPRTARVPFIVYLLLLLEGYDQTNCTAAHTTLLAGCESEF